MKTRAKNTTKEQDEYRASILKARRKIRKKTNLTFKEQCETTPITTYMNNCIFWITEYNDKGTNRERAISAANALKIHCENFLQSLNKQ